MAERFSWESYNQAQERALDATRTHQLRLASAQSQGAIDAQKKANEANEKRYAELMQKLADMESRTKGIYEQSLAATERSGVAAREQVQVGAQQAMAQGHQDLISRGLANTTVMPAMQRGITADAQRQYMAIDDQVAMQRAGIQERQVGTDLTATGMITSAIQNRNDVGPDLGLYASLLSQAGATGQSQPRTVTTMSSPGPSLWQQSQARSAAEAAEGRARDLQIALAKIAAGASGSGVSTAQTTTPRLPYVDPAARISGSGATLFTGSGKTVRY